LRDKDFGERADLARATFRHRCSIRLSYGATAPARPRMNAQATRIP
jgi:hypothetical protein